jgi:hypothetical protein
MYVVFLVMGILAGVALHYSHWLSARQEGEDHRSIYCAEDTQPKWHAL